MNPCKQWDKLPTSTGAGFLPTVPWFFGIFQISTQDLAKMLEVVANRLVSHTYKVLDHQGSMVHDGDIYHTRIWANHHPNTPSIWTIHPLAEFCGKCRELFHAFQRLFSTMSHQTLHVIPEPTLQTPCLIVLWISSGIIQRVSKVVAILALLGH